MTSGHDCTKTFNRNSLFSMTHVGGCWRVSHLSGGDSVYLCDDTVIIGSCLIAPIMLTLTGSPARVLFTSTSHFELKCAFKVLLEKCQCLSLTYSLVINCSNSEWNLNDKRHWLTFTIKIVREYLEFITGISTRIISGRSCLLPTYDESFSFWMISTLS